MKKYILLACLALSGCATLGPEYNSSMAPAPLPGKAQIAIFRPSSVTGPGGPILYINGQEKCMVAGNGISFVSIEPGNNQIKVKPTLGTADEIEIQSASGSRTYLEVSENKTKSGMAAAFGVLGTVGYNAASKNNADFIIKKSDSEEVTEGMRLFKCGN